MLKIYHVKGTRGFRVIWASEELGLEYEVVPVDYSPAYRASSEWRRISPVGKLPILTDGDLTMWESGAMVQYLVDRYGNGRLQPPPGTIKHALYLQWSWFAEATFARPLGEIANHRREFPDDAELPGAIPEMKRRAGLCVNAVNQALEGSEFILGETFTAADIILGYTVMLAIRMLDEPLPHDMAAYWQRLQSRPAFQACLRADETAEITTV